jgi:hypothetical protein
VIAGEDAAYIVFDMEHDVRALFDGNRHLDHATDDPRLTFGEGLFEGTRGTISLHGSGEVRCRAFGSRHEKVILPEQTWSGFAGDSVYAFQQHVVSHLINGTALETAASDYLQTLTLEALVYRSASEGRKLAVRPVPMTPEIHDVHSQ